MLPDPPRRGLAGMLYVLTLMLRHQAVGVLPLLLGYKHTVIYLPTPCPLPIAPHDFSRGAELVESGYATAKTFLDDLRLEGPGIYGHPHFHSAVDVPGSAVAVDEATSVDAIAAGLSGQRY
jgi:NTE family protein